MANAAPHTHAHKRDAFFLICPLFVLFPSCFIAIVFIRFGCAFAVFISFAVFQSHILHILTILGRTHTDSFFLSLSFSCSVVIVSALLLHHSSSTQHIFLFKWTHNEFQTAKRVVLVVLIRNVFIIVVVRIDTAGSHWSHCHCYCYSFTISSYVFFCVCLCSQRPILRIVLFHVDYQNYWWDQALCWSSPPIFLSFPLSSPLVRIIQKPHNLTRLNEIPNN